METHKKEQQVDTLIKSRTGSVYVGPERYTTIGKAALNVSNELGTGRIISAGEMAQYLVDNYLEDAWKAFAKDEVKKLVEQSTQIE